ncbi:hypothetical protein TEQG_03944 [Trichophyton equinum CBS 127.97]|uniref:Uncharacterized protein n=1 Tax=Trichophyton equinum (strain ATCC MYA-4606 / CBS 127.97) TaxID=559882 RepID=F2PSJ2_TRIEC|nr:hypothetical protein TEQG_03944 [Trichophyton equinum CBS 127.97]
MSSRASIAGHDEDEGKRNRSRLQWSNSRRTPGQDNGHKKKLSARTARFWTDGSINQSISRRRDEPWRGLEIASQAGRPARGYEDEKSLKHVRQQTRERSQKERGKS